MNPKRMAVAFGCVIGVWGFAIVFANNIPIAIGLFLAMWGNNIVQRNHGI